ncbi:hypothetical protein M413DRAFT_448084 [Hebeloma cylindrosporum]|uniref:COP9 signalosome complex subunit 3 n=1 Tax=Hebeloma cylindrosporum TaxID=76867 RepID=A0A0C3BMZ9_HEBCY|nr:hypothetical protein M413DRAFT_448084 [Hebeloma cylindrosporum h7]
MSSSNTTVFIDHVLGQITSSNNIANLNHTLKTGLQSKETVLSSFLSNGQDPLQVLDVRTHTLGALYILSSRLSANFTNIPPPPWAVVEAFCRNFNPDHARLAPERVTKLAKGIQRLGSHSGNLALAIQPLYHLVMQYPPNPAYLTTIHPIFVLTCVSTRYFQHALPVLSNPITEIDTAFLSPDLHYSDNLSYHYTGGVALAALKRWKEAEEFFEICVTSPGNYPAALQMEALKKLRLVQLISTGKVSNLPKYTNSLLLRLFKNTPYNAFINAYPNNSALMREIYDKERQVFQTDRNIGLIQQAAVRAPRWVLKKLTATYVTLHLSDIGRVVKIDSEDEVRALLLSMIESNDITAQIDANGTVTFSDPPAQFTKEQVDSVLRDVQEQTALLSYLEQEVGRSKEFLNKVVKTNEAVWMPTEEDVFANIGAQNWEDSVYS